MAHHRLTFAQIITQVDPDKVRAWIHKLRTTPPARRTTGVYRDPTTGCQCAMGLIGDDHDTVLQELGLDLETFSDEDRDEFYWFIVAANDRGYFYDPQQLLDDQPDQSFSGTKDWERLADVIEQCLPA